MGNPIHLLGLSKHQMRLTKHKQKRMVDTLAYVVGIGGNIAVIPQIIKAWNSNAPGLAVSTWGMFCLFGVIWLFYAIIHKQKPLIVAQVVGLICNLLVVSGWMFNNLLR